MSTENNDVPQEFYDVVDEFINLANDLGTTWPRSRVSATLMFAAARYNVYNWLNRDVDLEQSLEEAVAYYVSSTKRCSDRTSRAYSGLHARRVTPKVH